MNVFKILKDAVEACVDVIKFGSAIQNQAQLRLINDLQMVCSKVESAYSTVLSRLKIVKQNYNDAKELAFALQDFAADAETRNAFKPDHLCGEIDSLLVDLENNLDPLKYSLDIRNIKNIRDDIQRAGNLDMEIFEEYDDFTRSLDNLAADILAATDEDQRERVNYAQHTINKFQDDLFDAIKSMREAKDVILHDI